MDMIFVKGRRRNLISVGWQDHMLQVEFQGGRRYQHGGVPREVKDKLLRSPYPDKLFQQIVRGKYVSERVYMPPVAKPMPEIDYGELPF